jgi:hypothetical protein
MKGHVVTFVVIVVAVIVGDIAAQYVIHNVRSVRRAVGAL